MSKTTKILVLVLLFCLLLFLVTACSAKPSEIESIQLDGDYRTVYLVGEDLDLSGMELIVVNSDGTTSTVKVADVKDEIRFLNVSTDEAANQLEITVEYKKQRTTFRINVVTSDSDENKVNVLFDLNYEKLSDEERYFDVRKVLQLSKIEAPATTPLREKFAFDGWYKEEACKNAWNFSVDQVVLTSDDTNNTVHIYAKWTPYVEVKFVKNFPAGVEELVATRQVKMGGSLTDFPNIPVGPGEEKYIFEWDFNSFGNITQDLIVKMKEPVLKTYNIEFWDTVSGAAQVLYTLQNVPYGTDLLSPDTVLGSSGAAQIYTLQEISALSPANKEHYVFDGWEYRGKVYFATEENSTGPLRSVKENMQLFAHYEVEKFTVRFDMNYEDAPSAPSSLEVAYNMPIVGPVVTREGYDFDGWYKDAAGTRPWNFNTEKLVDNRTLFAKWTKLYTINFYGLYYGDAVGSSEKVPALNAASLADYTNNGIWRDTSGRDIFGTTYQKISEHDSDGNFEFNYYCAQENGQEIIIYTRIFIDAVSVREGETASTLPSFGRFAVAGHTAKWSSTGFADIRSDRDVYGIYTVRNYTVIFVDGNNQIGPAQVVPYKGSAVEPDDVSDANAAVKAIFDDYLLTVRNGYLFSRWSSEAYRNVTEDLTISAIFTPKSYRVTIQTQPGNIEVRTEPYDSVLTLSTPVRPGYDFDGWYTTQSYTPGSEWREGDKVTGAVSIYAKWVEIFIITFNDGATPVPTVIAERTVRKGADLALAEIPDVPEITGKNGVWREDGAVPSYINVQRNMIISAVYTDKTFEVNFKNGSYDDYWFLSGVVYGSKVTAPISPVDPAQGVPGDSTVAVGYRFEGWTVSGVSGFIDFSTYQIKQSTTFIASYSLRSFTVKFVDSDYDNTGIVLREVTVEYKAQAYPPASPSKEGMDFIGWSVNKNATLPQPNDYKSITGNTVVYALYRTKVYKVTFKSLEDNTTWATINVEHGSYAAYPSGSAVPTYTGYTFSRWDFDFSTPITGIKTIYAVFEIDIYTITFDSKGGSDIAPVSGRYNTYAVAPAEPTYEGMAFLGWYKDELFTDQYLFDQLLTESFTLYAKWAPFVSGFGGIVYQLNSSQTAYTVIDVNSDAIAVKIDNFYQNKPVTAIGSGALSGKTRVQVVILPETLKTIGANAFSGCANLRTVAIPQTVESIGDNAFNGCEKLASVTFPGTSALTRIGNNAFLGASALTGLVLPAALTTIGAGAFFGCTSLYELTVPRTVTSIGASAFEECTGLKYINFLKTSPSVLGANAFAGVTESFRIYVPDKLYYTSGVSATWQAAASIICPSAQIVSGWYYEIIQTGAHANSLRLLHYMGTDTVLNVPETLRVGGIDRPVYSFGDYLFDGKITEFKMNSDMPLSASTFGAATGLRHIQVSIVKPDGQQRELLNSNITYLRTAFETLPTLSELSVSATATLKLLFGNVNPPAGLKKVNILDDCAVLPENMFYNCLNIEEISIPASIETIGANAFYACYNLKKVTFAPGSSLTSIGGSAFENCVNLRTIEIPSTVQTIDSDAFAATPAIEESEENFVILGDGILYKYKGNAEIVTLPAAIKKINEYAFYGASLRSFIFEEGSVLVSVGAYAFAECVNLEHAVFPERMHLLGEGAFYNDLKLSKVIFFGPTEAASFDISGTTKLFVNTMQSLEIYIPRAQETSFSSFFPAIRAQLGISDWNNLYAGNLMRDDEWIYFSENTMVTLLQYFGDSLDVTVPDNMNGVTVTTLGNYIFPRNTRTLNLSVRVTAREKVFGGLSSLTEITLRAVEEISFSLDRSLLYNMFVANKSLATLNVGGKVSISALLGGQLPPRSLNTVNIAADETVLAAGMFRDCTYITTINLPSSLTAVGENAFDNSGWMNAYEGDFVTILRDINGKGLLVAYKGTSKFVQIPSDVKALNRMLFAGNTFVEIVSATNLAEIGYGAFANALTLNKVILRGEKPVIRANAFLNLIGGAQLFVDSSQVASYSPAETAGVTVVANQLVTEGDYLIESLTATTAKLMQYTGSSKSVEIPATVGGKQITSIGNNALYAWVESLTFSASDILTINSFSNLKVLKQVTVLDTNNILCDRRYLYNLLVANPSLTKLGYSGDVTLYSLLNNNVPPATLTAIEVTAGSLSVIDGMLTQCTGIRNIILPSSVRTVGLYAFEETAWFAAQPNYVVILDGYLYKYKGTDINVIVPNTVKIIGQRAFSYKSGTEWTGNAYMKSLKFQSGSAATAILDRAFYNCSGLKTVDFPSTLTEIPANAFEGTGIVLDTETKTLVAPGDKGDVLIKYFGTEATYELSVGVNTINAGAFEGNTYLTTLIFPVESRLVMIGDRAFSGCINLSNVFIREENDLLQLVTDSFYLPFIEDIGADAFALTPWWMNSMADCLFGETSLLLVKSNSETFVLSEEDVPNDIAYIASHAFASSSVTKLFVRKTSPLSLRLGALDSFDIVYIPSDLFGMYAAHWNAYAGKLSSANVSEGSFVNAGRLVYVDKTASTIAITDRCGLKVIPQNAFDGTAATILILTQAVPPALEGGLNNIVSIKVPDSALAAYAAAWSAYASILQGYSVQNGFHNVNNVLYQYVGSAQWLNVPEGTTRIADYAFSLAEDIQYLFLPSSVTQVSAFAYVGLENAVVAAASLEESSVTGLTNLRNNVLAVYTAVPAQSVGAYALKGSTLIRYLGNNFFFTVSNAITEIGQKAFANHPELRRISVPQSVTLIGSNAFYNCTSTVLWIGLGEAPVGFEQGWNNDILETQFGTASTVTDGYGNLYLLKDNSVTLLEAVGGVESMTIETFDGHMVTSIAANAFHKAGDLKKLILTSEIIALGPQAFAGCQNTVVYLNAAQVPAGWSSQWSQNVLEYYIGYISAFWDTATGLRYMIQNQLAVVIGYDGIAANVTVPALIRHNNTDYQVKRIAAYAFRGYTALLSVTLGSNVERIGAYAFDGCSDLASVVWPGNLSYIGAKAFRGTAWQNGAPEWIVSGFKGYYYAGSSQAVIIPETLTTLINGVFSSGVARYAVFASENPIANVSFTGLTGVLVPAASLAAYRAAWSAYANMIDAYTELNGALYYRGILLYYGGTDDTLTVPQTVDGYAVTRIENGAFANNTTLKKLYLPSSLSEVGESAFDGCVNLVIYAEGSTASYASGWSGDVRQIFDYTDINVVADNGVLYYLTASAAEVIGFVAGYKELTVKSVVGGRIVTSIAPWALLESELYRLTLPDVDITAKSGAFEGADRLVLIALRSTFTYADQNEIGEIYIGATNFETVTVSEGTFVLYHDGTDAVLLDYTGTQNNLVLPNVLGSRALIAIAGYAFYGCGAESIILNSSINYNRISANAFIGTGADTVVYCRTDLPLDGYLWAENAFEVHNRYSADYVSGPYQAIVYGDGVMITGYTGSGDISIVIPATLTFGSLGARSVLGIASYAFDSLDADLREIQIPADVQYIGKNAFSGASACVAANVVLLGGAERSGFESGWSDLFSDVLYGEAVEEGGVLYRINGDGAAVVGYTGQSSFVLIESSVRIYRALRKVTKIASYAFAGRPDLKKVFIPTSVISVRERIFYGASTELVLSLGHPIVSANWPAGWDGGAAIRLSSSIIETNGFLMLLENDFFSVARYKGTEQNVTIPASLLTGGTSHPVTAIEPYAFFGREGINRIYVPAEINAIGEFAFAGCFDALLFMGNSAADPAWSYREGETTVDYNSDVRWTYYSSGDLILRDGFRYQLIGATALLVDYTGAEVKVIVPDTINVSGAGLYQVTTIGIYAFAFRSDIQSITLPQSISAVYEDAFLGASSAVIELLHTEMPGWTPGWQGDALEVNFDASRIVVSGNFRYLFENNAMTLIAYTGNSETVELPATVDYAGQIYNVVKIGEYAFYANSFIRNVNFPSAGNTYVEIGAHAFDGCIALSVINGGNNIVDIGEYAFARTQWYTNLSNHYYINNELSLYKGNEEAVVFREANRVNAIRGGAFGTNSAVRYAVFLDGEQPNLYPNAFATVEKILVRQELLSDYINAPVWMDYADKIDSYIDLEGMLYYHNELIAIVSGTNARLNVLEEVDGYTIDTICRNVNKNQSDLQSLIVPESVTTIRANTFTNAVLYYEAASRLPGYSAEIQAQAEYFDTKSFFEVDKVQYTVIDGKATLIKYTTAAAPQYTVPASITFNGVVYPVNAIAPYAFRMTDSVKRSVYVPASVTSINRYAFCDIYNSGNEFIIYAQVPAGNYAWNRNSSMPVYFGVDSVENYSSLSFIVQNGAIVITGYWGTETAVSIPQTISVNATVYPVTSIGDCAFRSINFLKSVTIGSNIVYIGKYAFEGTKWLQDAGDFIIDNGRLLLYNNNTKVVVIIDESLGIRSIVGGAFSSSNVQRVVITGETPMIELYDGAFDGIRLIDVPDNSYDIYKDYIWTDYSSTIIGSTVRDGDIGYSIGYDGEVTVQKYLGTSATVSIPATVTFNGYTYTVTKLGDNLFRNNTNLIKINIPATVQTLGDGVFEGCSNAVVYLDQVSVPASWDDHWDSDLVYVYINISEFTLINDFLVQFEGAQYRIVSYYGNSSTVDLSDESYIAIGPYAFYGMAFIENVILNDKIESIGKDAFTGTGWAANGETHKIVNGKLMLYTGYDTVFRVDASIHAICGGAFLSSDVHTVDIEDDSDPIADAGAFAGVGSITVDPLDAEYYRILWAEYADIISARQ